VLICTVGGAIGGYCSIGSVNRQRPRHHDQDAMTIAKIGRSMKNLAIVIAPEPS